MPGQGALSPARQTFQVWSLGCLVINGREIRFKADGEVFTVAVAALISPVVKIAAAGPNQAKVIIDIEAIAVLMGGHDQLLGAIKIVA